MTLLRALPACAPSVPLRHAAHHPSGPGASVDARPLPFSAGRREGEGSLSILSTALPQRPLMVQGQLVYPLQGPFLPVSPAREIKTYSHSKVEIHDVKILSFVLGFSVRKKKKKETILHREFMAPFDQPLRYRVDFLNGNRRHFSRESALGLVGSDIHIYIFLNKQTLGVAFGSMQVQVICREGTEHPADACPPEMLPLLCLLCAMAHLKGNLRSEAITLQACRQVPGHVARLHPSRSV